MSADKLARGMPYIVADKVTKSFGSHQVLKGVSTQFCTGEVTVIIGASGSGKSTLLRAINRLEPHDGGRITIDGVEVTDNEATLQKQRCEVGMVFQQFNLFPHLTAGENVALSPTVVKGVKKPEAAALARQMLAKVGLGDKYDSYPDQLSGGQQQRVAIARALAMQPKVLLCDEITSALDPELVNEVLAVVKQLAAEGMTLIMVTHEMRFARDVGDQLVFMHQGLIHESGPAKQLFASPQTPELAGFIGAVH